MLKLCFKIAA